MTHRPRPGLAARVAIERLEGRLHFDVTIGTPNIVNISRAPGDQAEGTTVVNPLNPNQLFAASNEAGTSLLGAVSDDGGKTWQTRIFATGSDGLPEACCDPSAAFDEFGNLFFTYLGEQSNRAEVLMSTDGGRTFNAIASLGANADQPTIAAGHGSVWVAFQQESQGGPPRDDEVVMRAAKRTKPAPNTIDAGAVAYGAKVTGLGQIGRFGKAQEIAPPPGTNVGDITVGSAGQVIVAYQVPTGTPPASIYIRRDPDGLGRKGFGAPILVGHTNVTDFYPIPAQSRRTVDAEIGLAYDRSGSAYNGRLYMVYTDTPVAGSADTDTMLRFSDDDGQTWSSPIRVNDDTTTNSQFLPRIAVDSFTGAVGVTWYDCRNDTGTPPGGSDSTPDNEPQFYGAVGVPTATGVSFAPNFAVTTRFSNTAIAADPNDFGDYTGLAFANGVLLPAWADNSNSTGDNPDGAHAGLDLYTAQVPVQVTPVPSRVPIGEFGDMGGKLTVATPTGARAMLTLKGGTGTAFLNGNTIELALRGTTSRSVLTIKPIAGSLQLDDVAINGALGSLNAPGATLAGTLSATGALGKIVFGSVAGGVVESAGAITSVTAGGLSNAKILSGADPAPDPSSGEATSAFFPAGIGTIKITGAVTDSVIAAGVDPVDGVYGNGDDILPGGISSEIRSLIVKGPSDPSTRFVAGSFGKIKIAGVSSAATDPRFVRVV